MATEERKSTILTLPRKLHSGQVFDLDITKVEGSGAGIGIVQVVVGDCHPREYRVRVRQAVVGDRLQVRAGRIRRRVIDATVVDMLRAASCRIEPRCPHFGWPYQPERGCGGCVWQALDYAKQLQLKEDSLRRALSEQGAAVEVRPIVAQLDPWHYRNKMEFSFGDGGGRRLGLGLHPSGQRYEVLNLRSCDLLSDCVGPLLRQVRDWANELGLSVYHPSTDAGFLRGLTVREGKRTGQRLVELLTAPTDELTTRHGLRPTEHVIGRFAECINSFSQKSGVTISSVYWTVQRAQRGQATRFESRCLGGLKTLRESLHLPDGRQLDFEIHPRAFFQPNTRQAEVLYGQVLLAAGLSADRLVRRVLDLCCGTGTISLCVAPYAEQVLGVDLEAEAVANAKENARRNRTANVEFVAGDAASVLQARPQTDKSFDVAIVDPPRAGLSPRALKQLNDFAAPRLVYVSCNPAALARDATVLKAGGYRLRYLQPVDMFPHTAHVETVACFQRA